MPDRKHVNQEHASSDDTWESCPTGSLKAYASRLRSRHMQRRVLTVGGAMVGLCVVAAAAFYLPNFSSDGNGLEPTRISTPVGNYPPYGGMACREVVRDMETYFTTLDSEDRRGRIRQHLDDCPMCKRKYQERADELGVSIARLPPVVRDGNVDAESFSVFPASLGVAYNP